MSERALYIDNNVWTEDRESSALTRAFYDARIADLEERLDPARLQHSLNVSKVAAELASLYDVDQKEAALAGLLHDWDKEYDDPEILTRAAELRVEVDPELLDIPRLLHGPTAARALSHEFPQISSSIISAIEVHTTGAFDMSPLDICVYVADAIEPNRMGEGVERIRSMVGNVTLQKLFIETHGHFIIQAIRSGRKVYSRSLAIWNANSHIDGNYIKNTR